MFQPNWPIEPIFLPTLTLKTLCLFPHLSHHFILGVIVVSFVIVISPDRSSQRPPPRPPHSESNPTYKSLQAQFGPNLALPLTQPKTPSPYLNCWCNAADPAYSERQNTLLPQSSPSMSACPLPCDFEVFLTVEGKSVSPSLGSWFSHML